MKIYERYTPNGNSFRTLCGVGLMVSNVPPGKVGRVQPVVGNVRNPEGTFDPEPDGESPFFDAETWRPQPADGRTGLRVLRSCGV